MCPSSLPTGGQVAERSACAAPGTSCRAPGGSHDGPEGSSALDGSHRLASPLLGHPALWPLASPFRRRAGAEVPLKEAVVVPHRGALAIWVSTWSARRLGNS